MAVLLLVLINTFGFSQTKQAIMDTIIKINSLDDEPNIRAANFNEDKFYSSNATNSNNYYNFEKLKRLLSQEELVDLADNPNKVLRLYSLRERIWNYDPTIDIKKVFLNELKRKDTIQTISGCLIGYDITYSIVYHDYWNAVRSKALENSKNATESEEDRIANAALLNDKRMLETNEAIIGLDCDLYWLIYDRVFDGLIYDKKLNPAIANLAYKYNNRYAFEYLKKRYPDDYANIEKDYYTNIFPYADFETDNGVFYLLDFAKRAFEINNQEYIDIVLKKLRESKTWRYRESAFKAQIFEPYNVKL